MKRRDPCPYECIEHILSQWFCGNWGDLEGTTGVCDMVQGDSALDRLLKGIIIFSSRCIRHFGWRTTSQFIEEFLLIMSRGELIYLQLSKREGMKEKIQ